jgi:hypothetical protein
VALDGTRRAQEGHKRAVRSRGGGARSNHLEVIEVPGLAVAELGVLGNAFFACLVLGDGTLALGLARGRDGGVGALGFLVLRCGEEGAEKLGNMVLLHGYQGETLSHVQ